LERVMPNLINVTDETVQSCHPMTNVKRQMSNVK
jgi:hypothetical protein